MHLPCPQCRNEANTYLDEAKRYRMYCVSCGYDNYLKIASAKPKHIQVFVEGLGTMVDLYPNNKANCKEPTCRKEIYWATNPITGKRTPISRTKNGKWVSHFKDCTRPDKFSQRYDKNDD